MPENAPQQFGNYQTIRQLGQGGFAIVYLGQHIHLQSYAAIKVIRENLTTEVEEQQFLQEARTLAKLRHPHIIRILDFGIDPQTSNPFLVMEYASGGTLRSLYPRGTRMPLTEVISTIKQVADALNYAHRLLGLVHRDIKPENMLVDDEKKILLSDFGIAERSQTQFISEDLYQTLPTPQRPSTVVGTAVYMSPEQFRGKFTSASDQYALGAVTYEWLCGSAPFRGTLIELAMQHLNEKPEPLHKRLPSIAPQIEAVIMRTLEKDPEKRFPTIEDFALELEDAYLSLLTETEVQPAIRTRILSRSGSQITAPQGEVQTQPPVPKPIVHTQVDTEPQIRTEEVPDSTFHPSRRTVLGILGGLAVAGLATGAGLLITHPAIFGGSNTTSSLKPSTLITTHTHQFKVNTIAWSPDGTYIASASDDDTIQIWSSSSGANFIQPKTYNISVTALSWASKSQTIGAGFSDGTVQILDGKAGRLEVYSDQQGSVSSIAVSPTGSSVAIGYMNGNVYVRDIAQNRLAKVIRHGAPISVVGWSSQLNRVVSGDVSATALVWKEQGQETPLLYNGQSQGIFPAAWSPDGRQLVFGGLSGQVWIPDENRPGAAYKGHAGQILAVAWSPDGSMIASGGDDNTVQVWNVLNGQKVLLYKGHKDVINAVAWSPDGSMIASASNDSTVQVWQAPQKANASASEQP